LRVKREEPRIPFGTLVERGLVPPGTKLCDARKRHHAEVLADGTLRASGPSGEVIGSLHSVGAAVQGFPACNGWTFWCVEDEAGVLHPLDTFRRRAREDAARSEEKPTPSPRKTKR
jgi:modification methylase